MGDHGKLQRRLSERFLIALLITGFAESLLSSGINEFIIPTVRKLLSITTQKAVDLSPTQTAWMLALMLVIAFLHIVGKLIPITAEFLDNCGGFLQDALYQRIPNLKTGMPMTELQGTATLLLALIAIITIAILIIPFVIASFWYARYVADEIEVMRREEERLHKCYDQQRNLMLSDIAHDLRNPMTTVSGYATALADDVVTEPELQKRYLHAIQRKSRRVNDLINLLFDYSKLNSAGFKLNREILDINELLRENAALMYEDVEEKHMELLVDIPEKELEMSLDKLQFSRVITNLITNAMRHNPKGTRVLIRSYGFDSNWDRMLSFQEMKDAGLVHVPEPHHILRRSKNRPKKELFNFEVDDEIVAGKLADGKSANGKSADGKPTNGKKVDLSWYILVADTGVDIPEEVADHIFEPFAMGDESRSTKGGSGLGLSIAHQVVEMHGWKLTVTHAVEGYTKGFLIEIPRGRA